MKKERKNVMKTIKIKKANKINRNTTKIRSERFT